MCCLYDKQFHIALLHWRNLYHYHKGSYSRSWYRHYHKMPSSLPHSPFALPHDNGSLALKTAFHSWLPFLLQIKASSILATAPFFQITSLELTLLLFCLRSFWQAICLASDTEATCNIHKTMLNYTCQWSGKQDPAIVEATSSHEVGHQADCISLQYN